MEQIKLKGYTIVYRGENIKKPLSGRPIKVPDTHWYNLPTPFNDGIKVDKLDAWWCGCTNKEDIFKWWNKNEFNKHPKNFKIRVLAVPKKLVLKGRMQCVFDRREAKIIGTLNSDGTVCLQNKSLQPLLKTKKVIS